MRARPFIRALQWTARLSGSQAVVEVALWSRNLLNEQHAFRNVLGTYAIFNEPRTFGVEARLSY